MLTPEEAVKLDELKKKEASYVPLSDDQIKSFQDFTNKSFNVIAQEFLAASEPWKRICQRLETLAKHNQQLLMEVAYLKKKK